MQKITFFNDMEKRDTNWLNPNSQVPEKAYSGTYSSKVNVNSWYSSGISKKLSEIPYTKNTFIRASGWFFIPTITEETFRSTKSVPDVGCPGDAPFWFGGRLGWRTSVCCD